MIFIPSEQNLKEEYPILADETQYPEFKNLSDSDMRLGFYYSCKGSLYINLEPEKRIISILSNQKDVRLRDEVKNKYLSLNFSDELEASFIVWGKFVPDMRVMGYNAIYNIMRNCVKVSNEDVTKYMATDVSDLKQFMACQIEIGKNLGDIIRQCESGFGVAKKYRKQESDSKLTPLEKAMM